MDGALRRRRRVKLRTWPCSSLRCRSTLFDSEIYVVGLVRTMKRKPPSSLWLRVPLGFSAFCHWPLAMPASSRSESSVSDVILRSKSEDVGEDRPAGPATVWAGPCCGRARQHVHWRWRHRAEHGGASCSASRIATNQQNPGVKANGVKGR